MAKKLNKMRQNEADSYLNLIRRFPLRPIRNDDDHAAAVEIIGELLGDDDHDRLDSGTGGYLDTLILLVNKYEDERHSPRGIHLSPQEALRAIMNVNGMTQAEMGKVIGSESAVSMFLSGQRDLSKSHIKSLVARFRVDAGMFL